MVFWRRSIGEEEFAIAESQNTVKDGIADITVIVDGGWSKRSYGHSYNAKSGVVSLLSNIQYIACFFTLKILPFIVQLTFQAVIIGKNTKKLLFMGVRNKYCSICAVAANKNVDPKNHHCFLNWKNKPSSQMESDIIVEGFNNSIHMHKLRYTKFIGDGDSNVYAKLKDQISYKHDIVKIECVNHVIKNYTSALCKVRIFSMNVFHLSYI